LTGTDLHHLQEEIGADVVRAQVIGARKTIEEDKNGGRLTDMIDDDKFAEEEQKIINKAKFGASDPIKQDQLIQELIAEKLSNPARLELLNLYMARGMSYE
jgi:hypothetical protein